MNPPKGRGRPKAPSRIRRTIEELAVRVLEVGSRAVLPPGLAAHRALDTVGRGRRGRDRDVLDPLVVVRLQERRRGARVRVVVREERLYRRDRRTYIRLRGRVVRPIAELHVRRHRNREQDADDDDHDEELDQRETAFTRASRDPGAQIGQHVFLLETDRTSPVSGDPLRDESPKRERAPEGALSDQTYDRGTSSSCSRGRQPGRSSARSSHPQNSRCSTWTTSPSGS